MKKFNFLGVLAIVLLFAFTGCSDSDPAPESLTFENDDVEFKIDENKDFNVRFKEPTSVDLGMGLVLPINKNVTISGSISSADEWNDPVIVGEVSDIKTSDTTFNPYIPMAIGQEIKLTYVKDSGVIIQIKVDFPLPDHYAEFAYQVLVNGLDPDDDGDIPAIIGHLIATGFLTGVEDEAEMKAVMFGVFTYLGMNEACNSLMKGTYDIK